MDLSINIDIAKNLKKFRQRACILEQQHYNMLIEVYSHANVNDGGGGGGGGGVGLFGHKFNVLYGFVKIK